MQGDHLHAAAIANAGQGADDDAQLLRLESDARRVQVVTLHKSKGLEYPLVFLPYAGIGGRPPDPGQRAVVTGAEGRVLQWRLQAETSGWDAARRHWKPMAGFGKRTQAFSMSTIESSSSAEARWQPPF